MQHSFREASGVGLASQLSQGQRGGCGNTFFTGPAGFGWKHILSTASGVVLAAQFSQGQRGVDNVCRASWVGSAVQFSQGRPGEKVRAQISQDKRGGVDTTVSAGQAGWGGWQHKLRRADGVGLSAQPSQGQTASFAGQARRGLQHSRRRAGWVGLAAQLSQDQRSGVCSTFAAGPVGWGG